MNTKVNKAIQQEIDEIREAGLYKSERIITGPQSAEINTTEGKLLLCKLQSYMLTNLIFC